MTLILTHLNRTAVWHAADRLVTVRKGSRVQPYDSLSNKTIVYEGTDGYAAISYQGLAYLEGRPTDQWLVGILRGKPVEERLPNKPWTMAIGPPARRLSLGLAVRDIASALEAVAGSGRPPTQGEVIFIVVAGWQLYRRKRPRPFATGIRFVTGNSCATVASLFERHVGRSEFLSIVPDIHLSGGLDRRLLRALAATPASEREELLVSAVRRAAKDDPTVGTDATVVLLPHPSLGWGAISFHPLRKRRAVIEGTGAEISVSAAYSPWILTHSELLAPGVCIGDSVHPIGPIRLIIRGEEGSSVVYARGSQTRLPPP